MFRRSITISLLVTGTLLSLFVRWLGLRFGGAQVERRQALFGRVLAGLCRRLGATFIKLAQVLATRSDLLSAPARSELEQLHDQVGPFPFRLARQTLVEELGAGPEHLFEVFDPYPVASASVAQVHRAVLADGRELAVKVLRPKVEELVDVDLRVMRTWARILGWLPPFSAFAPRQVLEEFAHALWRQLDLRIEAANNRRFRENFVGDAEVTFPALVDELCTRRVLCMEFVHGRRILDPEPAHGADVEESDEGEVGADPGGTDEAAEASRREQLAKLGYRMILQMVFEHGFVHADLHPGNLRVRQDQGLVLFDLGLVAELPASHRRALVRLCLAWVARDVTTICEQIGEVAFHGEKPGDPERLEQEVKALLARYGDIALGEIQVGRLLLDLLGLVRRQWAGFDPSLTMVALSIAVVEGVARQLAPDLRLMQEALPHFQRLAAATVTTR